MRPGEGAASAAAFFRLAGLKVASDGPPPARVARHSPRKARVCDHAAQGVSVAEKGGGAWRLGKLRAGAARTRMAPTWPWIGAALAALVHAGRG
ncbi:hypothetical protein DZD18_10360 [Rhodobacteraceae bacterium W635]|nr:hypothetical protein DZD18_10360 [Rhodobacteraceae bacterium W635]